MWYERSDRFPQLFFKQFLIETYFIKDRLKVFQHGIEFWIWIIKNKSDVNF